MFLLLYEINSLSHSGIRGMRWGRRRYQNSDGSLTPLGRVHYGVSPARSRMAKDYLNAAKKREQIASKKDRTYHKQSDEMSRYDAKIREDARNEASRRWRRLNEQIDTDYFYDKEREYDDRVKKYGKEKADKWFDQSVRREMTKKQRNKKFGADYQDRVYDKMVNWYDGDRETKRSKEFYRINDKYDNYRNRYDVLDTKYINRMVDLSPEVSRYDRGIQQAFDYSLSKAQKKYDRQQARRQFAASMASIAGQRLADYAVDAAVGAVSKQLNKAILDNKPSKGGYDYRQDVINTTRGLKNAIKKNASSPSRVMTEAKLAPSYKNLYNRLKASGRVNSFNQFLNEVYYPDLERRR